MTDLRNLTILGLLGRVNALIDEGKITPTPADIKLHIADRSILDYLSNLYGTFPEFNPIHAAERTLLLKELKMAVDKYGGRESFKMGIERNGLCLLVGYCAEMLMERNIREVTG
jgi:hypothetical protein